MSARKARLVLDQIRGKPVGEALATLQYTPRAAARLIEKVLRSAVANAEHNHQVRDLDDLRVVQAMADGGPSLKRVQPRAMGRAFFIKHRTSHLTIGVTTRRTTVAARLRRRDRRAALARSAGAAAAPARAGGKAKGRTRKLAMGQKTHPIGFRLGSTRTWSSRWFATKDYAALLHEDVKIRRFIKDQLYHAGISSIDIERSANRARITISTARPGIIIGRKGSEVEKLKNELQMRTGKEIYLNIEEVIHPELDAQLVAENVALQLQKRVAFRRAMKKAVTSALRLGADGIRIACAGRLGGGEIARREWYRDGRVPLHTHPRRHRLRPGRPRTRRTATIGVKVWIFKGEVLRASAAAEGLRRRHADAQARQVSQGPARAA